jgi:hypothetical protein
MIVQSVSVNYDSDDNQAEALPTHRTDMKDQNKIPTNYLLLDEPQLANGWLRTGVIFLAKTRVFFFENVFRLVPRTIQAMPGRFPRR